MLIITINKFANCPEPVILKKSGKYDSGLSCCWALFTARAFGFKLHLIFNRVEFKKRFILFGGFSW